MPDCAEHEVDYEACGCRVADSSCINVSGSGESDNPFLLDPVLDGDSRNLVTCEELGYEAGGLLATMPDRFVWPTMKKSQTTEVPLLTLDPIPFTEVDDDPYLMSTTDEVTRIPFDGKWRISTDFYIQGPFPAGGPSYLDVRIEIAPISGLYRVLSVAREMWLTGAVAVPFWGSFADEVELTLGSRIRITVGVLEEESVIRMIRAAMSVTLVSL